MHDLGAPICQKVLWKQCSPDDGDVGCKADEQEGGCNAEGSCGDLLLDSNASEELGGQRADHSNHGQSAVDGLGCCKAFSSHQMSAELTNIAVFDATGHRECNAGNEVQCRH